MKKSVSLLVVSVIAGLVTLAYGQGGVNIEPKQEPAFAALPGPPSYANCRALLSKLQSVLDSKEKFNYISVVLLTGEELSFEAVDEVNHDTGAVTLKNGGGEKSVTTRTIHVEWLESVILNSGGVRLE